MNEETIDARFENGKLHPDSAAAAAIKALPPGPHTLELVTLEDSYQTFMGTVHGQAARMFAGPALKLIRQQLAIAIIENQELLLQRKCEGVQQNFGAEYHRVAEELRGFRAFLKRYFEQDMEIAEGLNKSVLEVAKEIMLRDRQRRTEIPQAPAGGKE